MNYLELEPEQNTFYVISADITHRCNMMCSNCYLPNRTIPDIDLARMYDLLDRLPHRCEIRLLGGEPTLHPKLPEIIHKVRELGHRPVVLTNGLRLADFKYAQALYESGLRSVYISFNGVDRDDWYQITDGMKCSEKKRQALENAVRLNMYTSLGCIIMKGLNEQAPKRLLGVLRELKGANIVLRIKNVGQVGRYSQSEDDSLTFDELINLVAQQFDVSAEHIQKQNLIHGEVESNSRLFKFPNPSSKSGHTWVKLTNWHSFDPGNARRGRITQDFKIAPFTEHVKANEFQY